MTCLPVNHYWQVMWVRHTGQRQNRDSQAQQLWLLWLLLLFSVLFAAAASPKKSCWCVHVSWPEVGTWGVQGLQNVPRSAWVKTYAASKTANATSVFTHALRGTFCTPCTPPPPKCPLLMTTCGFLFLVTKERRVSYGYTVLYNK